MSVLWDIEIDDEACDYNGEPVIVEGQIVYVKDLGCSCNPDFACGGCIEITNEFIIGEGRYEWR